jgi:hypothetical protein
MNGWHTPKQEPTRRTHNLHHVVVHHGLLVYLACPASRRPPPCLHCERGQLHRLQYMASFSHTPSHTCLSHLMLISFRTADAGTAVRSGTGRRPASSCWGSCLLFYAWQDGKRGSKPHCRGIGSAQKGKCRFIVGHVLYRPWFRRLLALHRSRGASVASQSTPWPRSVR